MFGKQVIFELCGQLYGVDSMIVRTIEAAVSVQPLAGAPESILGIVNLRGTIVPICDIHGRLHLPAPVGPKETMFVTTIDGELGFYVDAVKEIAVVDNDIQGELPSIIKSDATAYVAGVIKHNGKIVTILNTDYLLSDKDKTGVRSSLNQKTDD